ncbi:MAG: kynureninase [Chitinophagales bacterium]|nr:kynureninase [Chitinophagales bacterium]
MQFKDSLSLAEELDRKDPLSSYRNRFYFPQHHGEDAIYFCGNSLGLQPKTVKSYIEQELEDWKNLGVEGHFAGKNPWMYYHHFVAEQAASLVGASKEEVVVMNTLSVNLNLMMVSFYQPSNARYKIMIEADAFPSDHYAVQEQAKFHGFDPKDAIIQLYPREGEYTLRTEDILARIQEHGDSLALVMLGGVNYYTGQFFKLEEITKAGHEVGAFVGFDLAHAAGNLPLELHAWNIDFATWCSYKYLNSGPGGVSGVFIHEKHHKNRDLPRFAGWWGHDEKTRFKMAKDFVPMESAAAWQMSNAQILPMAAHWASLEIFKEVGIKSLREKSLLLTGFLEFLLDQNEFGFKIITPRNTEERGCQLSLLTEANGKDLFKKLQYEGVIADWREPNVIRIAPVPLYNSFKDVFRFVEILKS